MSLAGQTILLTGGTGTFGRHFLDFVLSKHEDVTVRVYSRDELKQSELRAKLAGRQNVRFLVGDVRDATRLHRAAEGCDVIVHAAALKQVPSCEYNPFEAVKTNVLGTQNVVEAALDCGVPRSILISSDKAVNPINTYGATKLLAEKVFVQSNAYAGGRDIRFSCVRYGNVIGSRGSVLEVFREQAASGTVTITDPEATRFWLTPQTAVDFVLRSLDIMRGGEVFVPELPSMKVVDLVPQGCKIEVIGLRPGEKLHELLIANDEVIYRIGGFVNQSLVMHDASYLAKGPYSSDDNTEWITREEFEAMSS